MNPIVKQKQVNFVRQYLNWQDLFGAIHLECPNPDHVDIHPSAFVYPNGIYCHGCGWQTSDITEAGAVFFDWNRKETHRRVFHYLTTHPPRADKVVQIRPIPLEKIEEWAGQRRALDGAYLYKVWGVTPQIQEMALLGCTGRAFVIPHIGLDGRVWAVKFRKDDRKKDNARGSKYWAFEKRPFTFLYPSFMVWAITKQEAPKRIILCEGEFDALAAISSGHAAVSLPSGANTALAKWAWFWQKLVEFEATVYLAFDKDNAGDHATQKAFHYFRDNFPKLLVIELVWDGDAKDVADLIAKGGVLL